MSKKARKQKELTNPLITVRVPLWRSEWEAFREAVRALDETHDDKTDPYEIVAALVRAVANGDIIPERIHKAPRS